MSVIHEIAAILCLFSLCTYAVEWGYDNADINTVGPERWVNVNKICGGERQSPIDISTDNTAYDSGLDVIELETHWNTDLADFNVTITNVGSSVKVEFEGAQDIETSQGGIKWKLAQFHYHWGKNDSYGSEHTINGYAYPAEVHFVHMNTKYKTLTEAVAQRDGLMVMGYFIKVGKAGENVAAITNALFEKFNSVTFKDQKTKVDLSRFTLKQMIEEAVHNESYHYAGSLTTPDCQQSVTWNVMNPKYALVISQEQMNIFRSLWSKNNTGDPEHMSGNWRPVQPLNGRLVRRNFNQQQATEITTTPVASTVEAATTTTSASTVEATITTSATMDYTVVRICSAATHLTAAFAVLPTLLIILGKVIDCN